MTEENTALALVLDGVLPRRRDRGDWEQVLQDGGRRPRSWGLLRAGRVSRFALVGAVVVLAAVIPIAALAVSNDWWFLGATGAPAPAGSVIVLRTGVWHGVPWTLTAYRSQPNGVCTALTPDSPSGLPAAVGALHTAALGCATHLRGIANASPPFHSLSFVASSTVGATASGSSAFLVGAAADDVTQVEISLTSGAQIVADTFAAPDALGVPVRFFVTATPAGDRVQALAALDTNGRTLERLTVPEAPRVQQNPAGSAQTMVTGGVDWVGP